MENTLREKIINSSIEFIIDFLKNQTSFNENILGYFPQDPESLFDFYIGTEEFEKIIFGVNDNLYHIDIAYDNIPKRDNIRIEQISAFEMSDGINGLFKLLFNLHSNYLKITKYPTFEHNEDQMKEQKEYLVNVISPQIVQFIKGFK